MTLERRHVCLLASVTSEAEASLAAAAGADIIDCKSPKDGALGALPPGIVAAIRAVVPSQSPVSATIGDLPLEPDSVLKAVAQMASTGADIVKIGLFPGPAPRETIAALSDIARQTKLVAVMLADRPRVGDMIDHVARAGFLGVMLDTAGKSGQTLLDHMSPDELRRFIDEATARGLMTGLAGSLRAAQIPALMALAPDILGFRGALCKNGERTAELDAGAIAAIKRSMDHARPSSAHRELEQPVL